MWSKIRPYVLGIVSVNALVLGIQAVTYDLSTWWVVPDIICLGLGIYGIAETFNELINERNI